LAGWTVLERMGALSSKLGREVDLVDLRSVSALLRFEVVTRGTRILAHDPLACDRFEVLAISMYQQHHAEQLPRFRDIYHRGRVF
jgi:hypothetical protein